MEGNTIHHPRNTDNAAAVENVRHFNAEFARELNAAGGKSFGCVNEHVAPEPGFPVSVFDVLEPVDNQPRPRLLDADSFHAGIVNEAGHRSNPRFRRKSNG